MFLKLLFRLDKELGVRSEHVAILQEVDALPIKVDTIQALLVAEHDELLHKALAVRAPLAHEDKAITATSSADAQKHAQIAVSGLLLHRCY